MNPVLFDVDACVCEAREYDELIVEDVFALDTDGDSDDEQSSGDDEQDVEAQEPMNEMVDDEENSGAWNHTNSNLHPCHPLPQLQWLPSQSPNPRARDRCP